ncbi:hypothetical protein EV1_003883 [Malus domestica]
MDNPSQEEMMVSHKAEPWTFKPKTGSVFPVKKRKKKDMDNPSQEEMMESHKAEPWTFKPKTGSVFPVKKRLVKRMMLDQIVQCFLSLADTTAGVRPSETSNAMKIVSSHVFHSHHIAYEPPNWCKCFVFC